MDNQPILSLADLQAVPGERTAALTTVHVAGGHVHAGLSSVAFRECLPSGGFLRGPARRRHDRGTRAVRLVQPDGDSRVDDRARKLAHSFGIRAILVNDDQGGLAGTTYAPAARAGIPALLAEAGGQGVWDEASVDIMQSGARRVMAAFDMYPAIADPGEVPEVLAGWSLALMYLSNCARHQARPSCSSISLSRFP